MDTNSQLYNDNSDDGLISILDFIKQVKVKLPSLKKFKLAFRERDFTLISELMKKKYIFHVAYTAEISKEITQGGDFMTERQIISWIAQAEDTQIDVTQHIGI